MLLSNLKWYLFMGNVKIVVWYVKLTCWKVYDIQWHKLVCLLILTSLFYVSNVNRFSQKHFSDIWLIAAFCMINTFFLGCYYSQFNRQVRGYISVKQKTVIHKLRMMESTKCAINYFRVWYSNCWIVSFRMNKDITWN